MSKPVEIELVLNPKEFKRGTKDTEAALDDVSDALDDLVHDSERQARQIGDDLGDGVKNGVEDAEDQIEKLERTFRELATEVKREDKQTTDAIEDHWRDANRQVERSSHDGFGEAGETTRTFKEEALANFSEVASSFDGSMQGVADGVQGTLGGLAASLPGPVGLISGILAGVGGAMLANFTTSAEGVKQVTSDMYADMTDSGEKYLSDQFILAQSQKLLNDEVDGQRKYADMVKDADLLGLSVDKVVLAYAGQASAIKDVRAAVEKANAAYSQPGVFTDETGYANVKNQIGGISAALDGVVSSTDSAGNKARVFDDISQKLTGVAGSADKVQAALDSIKNPDVKVNLSTTEAERKLQALENKPRVITFQVDGKTRQGRPVF